MEHRNETFRPFHPARLGEVESIRIRPFGGGARKGETRGSHRIRNNFPIDTIRYDISAEREDISEDVIIIIIVIIVIITEWFDH